jgi:hypothetical protein
MLSLRQTGSSLRCSTYLSGTPPLLAPRAIPVPESEPGGHTGAGTVRPGRGNHEARNSLPGLRWCSMRSEGSVPMRILTYLLAAALLWAVASSGPATSTSANDDSGRAAPAQRGAPPARAR